MTPEDCAGWVAAVSAAIREKPELSCLTLAGLVPHSSPPTRSDRVRGAVRIAVGRGVAIVLVPRDTWRAR